MHATFNKQDGTFNIEGISKVEFCKLRFFLNLSLLWLRQNEDHILYTQENEALCEYFNDAIEKGYVELIKNKEVL